MAEPTEEPGAGETSTTESSASDASSGSNRLASALGAGMLVLLVGVAGWIVYGPDDDTTPTAAEPEPSASSSAPPQQTERGRRFEPTPEPEVTYERMDPSSPVRLSVPSVGIEAPVVSIPLQDGSVLDPPSDPSTLGWWDDSARPGDRTGQTVITGHTVSTGGGAMDPMVDVEPGSTVDVETNEGTMRYRVTEKEVVTRPDLAERAEEIFGQDVTKGRLVIVTCTNWNGAVWEDNLVVYGTPLGEPSEAGA